MDDIWIATWRVAARGTRGESLPDPVSCDVKMWDECARDWGGGVKKGDVILLEGESPRVSNADSRCRVSTCVGRDQPGPAARLDPGKQATQADYSLQDAAALRGEAQRL